MKQLLLLNPEKASEKEVKNYRIREAARAVVVDKDGMIALLYISKEDCYKLPGGGLEGAEDKITALQRECKEETGCDIEIVNEIGSIVEYRKGSSFKQISYCYLVKVKGQKGISNFTEKELQEGFKTVWLPYSEAKQVLSESKTRDFEINTYRLPREKALLEEVKNYLNRNSNIT